MREKKPGGREKDDVADKDIVKREKSKQAPDLADHVGVRHLGREPGRTAQVRRAGKMKIPNNSKKKIRTNWGVVSQPPKH